MRTPCRVLLALAAPVACVAFTYCTGCRHAGADGHDHVDDRLVAATNDFGIRLLRNLAKSEANRNVFVSPASVELALAMTYNGAAGATRDQMGKTLGVGRMSLDELNRANADLVSILRGVDPKVETHIANSLWAHRDWRFDEAFLKRCAKSYDADVRSADLQAPGAADRINDWVKGKTKGKIDKIADTGTLGQAVLVLVNALYFKGEWSAKFDPANTRIGPFTPPDGKQIAVPMMSQTGDFQYAKIPNGEMICLPYGAKRMAAYVLLPANGAQIGDCVQGLASAKLQQWIGQMTDRHGSIALPKLKCDYTASLGAPLAALGMPDAFTRNANFTAMLPPGSTSGSGPLYIGAAIHKTTLEVNEEGTVATAATEVVVARKAMPLLDFTMVVDRPFVLALRDTKSGVILFIGSIVRPQ